MFSPIKKLKKADRGSASRVRRIVRDYEVLKFNFTRGMYTVDMNVLSLKLLQPKRGNRLYAKVICDRLLNYNYIQLYNYNNYNY